MFVILLIMACSCSSLIDLHSLSSQVESFGKIISQLAAEEGVTEDKIMLSLSDTNILGYDTPSSIHLSVADIIGEFTYINDSQFDISYFVQCGARLALIEDIKAYKRSTHSLALPTIV